MADPLEWLEPLVSMPVDAVRWACVLEATAPKAGNVFPGRPFDDLTYADFINAAEITAQAFARPGRISDSMLAAVQQTAARCKTNVNLGIVLLLGPLVAADRQMLADKNSRSSAEKWQHAIARQLAELDEQDGQNLFRAIASASAGGLGSVDEMDVQTTHGPTDLLAAMRLAANRDLIARQYATGFQDVVHTVAPLLHESIMQSGDLLQGICRAHVQLLAMFPDSLIARKNGLAAAVEVQALAGSVDAHDRAAFEKLDASLRGGDHRRNPGTIADLIAAALYILLRTSACRDT